MKLRKIAQLLAAALLLAVLPISGALAQDQLFAMVSGTGSLNIRSGPGVGYEWLGNLQRGGWVEIRANYGDWYQVYVMEKGISGYMSAKFLKTAGATGSDGTNFVVNNPRPTQFLNLRQYPDLNAPVLGIFYNGASGTVLSETGGWYQVSIAGMVGYFRGEYLRFTGAPGGGTVATVYAANGGAVNLRSGPGYNYASIAQLRNGNPVTVHLKGRTFWYVSSGGRSGFMDAKFLRTGSTPVPPIGGRTGKAGTGIVTQTGKRLNLREQASLNARVLGQYPGGTELTIEAQGADWCRVVVRSTGARGYMMSRFITVYGVPGSSTRRVVHPNGSFVYLRSQPYQGVGTVIVKVPHGSVVSVVAPDGAWTKVRYGNYVGYMMSAFLR